MAKLPRPGANIASTNDDKVNEDVVVTTDTDTDDSQDNTVLENGETTATDSDSVDTKPEGDDHPDSDSAEETPPPADTNGDPTPEVQSTDKKDEDAETKPDEEINDPVAKDSINNGITLTPTVTADTKPLRDTNPNVKIRMKDKHACTIGGTSYVFEKGKMYSVPENVKKVLARADKLSPL